VNVPETIFDPSSEEKMTQSFRLPVAGERRRTRVSLRDGVVFASLEIADLYPYERGCA
jgi:hypothetical protein